MRVLRKACHGERDDDKDVIQGARRIVRTRSELAFQGREIVLRRMEDVHHADFARLLDNAEDDEVVADGAAAIPRPAKHGVPAEFMGGGHLLEVRIAPVDRVRKP